MAGMWRGILLGKRREKVQFRYYEMPEGDLVLALLGRDWVREYGNDIDCLHFHNFLEVGYCHEGVGEFIVEEHEYKFEPGVFVIVPPNILHTTNSKVNTKAFWEWMYFDIERYVNILYQLNLVFDSTFIKNIYEKPIVSDENKYPVLAEIIKNIMREAGEKKPYYRESIKGWLYSFMFEVLRINTDINEKENKKKHLFMIRRAIEFVADNYNREIKILDLAKACNMSESHFRRNFLETMNMRPNDYINLIRIQKACELIKQTEKSMEDIAYSVGFITMSTFDRNFKKLLGVSPCKWKKFNSKLSNYNINAYRGW